MNVKVTGADVAAVYAPLAGFVTVTTQLVAALAVN